MQGKETIKRFFAAALLGLLVFSCVPKKEALKPLVQVQQQEEFTLPDVLPKVEEKKPRPRPRQSPITIEVEDDEKKFIILNFDGADIQTVIATFGELLEMNYILSPGISGSVTIQSYKKFPMEDLFTIFQTILEMNGLTALKDGALYRIVPIDSARMQPLDVKSGKEFEMRLDASFVTQIIPLQYVKASDIANSILRPLMPRGTNLIIYEPTNMLIVTALPHALSKVMKVIEAIDISEADKDMVKTFVYYVENGEAKKLASILKTLYSSKKGATPTPAPAAAAAAAKSRRTPASRRVATPTEEALPGEIGDITITAYEDINALLVKSTARTYIALLEVLKRIDVPVKQVLIEVMIVEVRLDENTQFGLEWLLKTSRGIGGFSAGGVSVDPNYNVVPQHPASGFNATIYGVLDSALFSSLISSFSSTNKVNVLASPHILAMDNKEAKIEIGQEVPTATSSQQATTAGTAPIVQQIQYKTVGTILTVTPRVTDKGMVTMKIVQEVSSVDSIGETIGTGTYPKFTTRKAQTTAIVESGKTLVLGGLIQEYAEETNTGIPWLRKIPFLGKLFSTTKIDKQKVELLLFVTPHVISNQDEADRLTETFKNKVKSIKKRLESTNKEKTETPKDLEVEPEPAPKDSEASSSSPRDPFLPPAVQ